MDNESLRHFYFQNELTAFNKIHTPTGFLPQTFVKILRNFEFYAGLDVFFDDLRGLLDILCLRCRVIRQFAGRRHWQDKFQGNLFRGDGLL